MYTNTAPLTVNSATSIKDITRAVDQNAINTFQRLLNEAKEIIEDLTYAGTGITYVEDAYEAASRHYTLDSSIKKPSVVKTEGFNYM